MGDSRTKPSVSSESLASGYEVKDAHAGWIFLTAVLALILGFVIHLLYWWLFLTYKRNLEASDKPRTAVAHQTQLPPEPRLQLNPQLDLIELHGKNIDTLTHSAWIDRNSGWVRIPIEDAMELMVQESQKQGRSK